MPKKRNDADDVPLTAKEEQTAQTLLDPRRSPVMLYLEADRQADETPAMWLARCFVADIERERRAAADEPPDNRARALQLVHSLAQTRKAQMDIIARAAEVEHAKSEDAQVAAVWRAMVERSSAGVEVHEKPASRAMDGKTRAERAVEWKTRKPSMA